VSKFACQSGLSKLKWNFRSYSADRQQAVAAAWPPRAVADLTPLPGVLLLKPRPSALPAHSHSPSLPPLRSSARPKHRSSSAFAPPCSRLLAVAP